MALPILHVRLFGELNLLYREAPVAALSSARLQSMLAYLLLHCDAPQPRHHIAYQFWPDATDLQARNNLRQTLHQLRQVLPDADRFLMGDANTLRWREDASFRLDVAQFEHALTRAHTAERLGERITWRSLLEEAVNLYRADLLPSCYDEWIVPERERLRQQYEGALSTLVRLEEALHEYAAAVRHAQTWIRHDPLAEDAYHALMRLLALSDDRAGALRAYQNCVATLQRELGIEPGPEMQKSYKRLLQLETQPAVFPEHGNPPARTHAFIGRQREWDVLQTAWQHGAAGSPRFVLVSGEAGIGKSRLAEELLIWADQHQASVAKTRSYAAEGQLSLAPVADWLRSDSIRPHLARLDTVWRTEVARILPELLVEQRESPRPEPIAEYGQRQRFFEALARAILAAPHPLLLLINDLQWCDQETLEWLHFLLRFDSSARLLVVGTMRAEELAAHPPLRNFLLHLGNTVGVTEIALQPLDAAETAALAAQVAGHGLDTPASMRLFRETEGNPLFVVETVRASLSQAAEFALEPSLVEGRVAAEGPTLPPRVYAAIAGRLGQLSERAREIVGLAAAIGRAFTLDILLRAGHADEDGVVDTLDELWNKRIVREHGIDAYDFTHDKLREVAYMELSAPQRRLLHRRIAQAFEGVYADEADPVSGQIAFHYEHAGMAQHALPWYQRAATVAQRVYAIDDAISLLLRGLALLEGLQSGAKRDTQELSLLLLLAPAWRITKGWASPEAEQTLNRALELCNTVGGDAELVHVLNGLLSVYVVQAQFDKVEQTSSKLDELYRRTAGIKPSLFTGVMLCGTRLHRGNLQEGSDRLGEIIAVRDLDQMRRVQEAQGVNYTVHARAWQAHALWCLGYAQSALTRSQEAVEIAGNLAQPFSQAFAATYHAMLMELSADHTLAKASAMEALTLTTEFQAPYYRAWSAILLDFALACEQPDASHITQLRMSIGAVTATGARLRLPYFLSLLARACGKAGRGDEAIALIDEALTTATAQLERWWDAELHRLRGELLLEFGVEELDAEASLLRAVEIARAQHAKSLELRAVTSLARHRISQRRPDDGLRMLADLVAWFDAGLDTPDLLAARSLLAHSGGLDDVARAEALGPLSAG